MVCHGCVAFFGLLLIQGLWSQSGHMTTIPCSEFENYLEEGKISEVVITSQYIRGTLKGAPEDNPQHVGPGSTPPWRRISTSTT